MTSDLETVASQEREQSDPTTRKWVSWLIVVALIYLLLAGVDAVGDGFKAAAGDNARELFDFATNPMVALTIGLSATALIQSSSTVSSIIVAWWLAACLSPSPSR